jgi:mannan endo-1,4-beta-mannosidase
MIRQHGIGLLLCAVLAAGCGAVQQESAPGPDSAPASGFVTVEDGRFELQGEPYYYAGTNFWYGAYLGAPGETGDRDRLRRELDILKANGITNLRVLAASEASELVMSLEPAIQTAPGEYNADLLKGLDFLLAEMGRRDMKAVLFLNNYWQWSGGMNQYVAWITGEEVVDPDVTGDWERFIATSAEFYRLPEAQRYYRRLIKTLIQRENTVTGVPYRNDPAIMAWQLANEPRPGVHGQDEALNQVFVDWVEETAAYIQRLDDNHLVSTGSEGSWGTLEDDELYMRAHKTPHIDYLTVHLWIKNWSWFDIENPEQTYDRALANSRAYLNRHIEMAEALNKPLTLEEFGVERDNADYRIESSTVYRDRFLKAIYELIHDNARRGGPFMGSNFWTWGGLGRAQHEDFIWRPGDAFTGDPPQEPQGLNSVFDVDESTLEIIRSHAEKMKQLRMEVGK